MMKKKMGIVAAFAVFSIGVQGAQVLEYNAGSLSLTDNANGVTWTPSGSGSSGMDATLGAGSSVIDPVSDYFSRAVNNPNSGIFSPFQSLPNAADQNDFTFELWVKPADLSGTNILFETGGYTVGTSILLVDNTIHFVHRGAGVATDTSGALAGVPSDFIQVVGVMDVSAGLTLYINGAQVDSASITISDWAGANGSQLGGTDPNTARPSTWDFAPTAYDGEHALCRFYDTALTGGEISTLYDDIINPTLEVPTGLTAVAAEGSVFLSWDANVQTIFDFFTMYRSTTSGSDYSAIASNLTTSSYTDNTVVNGTTYYYAVTATDTNGTESGFSGEEPATPVAISTNVVLYQHLDANVPGSVTTSGDEVTSWADQSGFGNDATDGAGDPVLFPSISLSGSGFPGLDVRTNKATLNLVENTDALLNFSPGGGAETNTGFAVLVAFKADSILGGTIRDMVIGNSANIVEGFTIRYQDGIMRAYLGGTSIQKNEQLPVEAGDTIVFGLNYVASTGEMVFWDSKNDHAATNTTSIAGDFREDFLTLAGSQVNGEQAMDGMVGEVQIYASRLTAAEFETRRTALGEKWGATSGANFSTWASGWIMDIGSETNDFDEDGLNNLYEYGLNGNPTNLTVDPAVLPEIRQTASGLEYVHVQRNDDPALVYTMESTTDLVFGSWSNAASSVTGIGAYSELFDVATNSVSTTDDQLFIRLKIEN